MIIRQTTTIIFEYPQDYLQEQEWCKTKEDRWVHKGTDTLGAVYENQISYSIGVSADCKTENCSEKPNNCEVKNYCDDCLYTDTCDSKEFFYACTSKATISKMEQVDEPQTCYTCEYEWKDGTDEPCVYCYGGSKYKPKDEPQTCEDCKHNGEKHAYDYACDKCTDMDKFQHEDEPQTCSVNGRPYDCGNCEYFRCTADEPQTERSE